MKTLNTAYKTLITSKNILSNITSWIGGAFALLPTRAWCIIPSDVMRGQFPSSVLLRIIVCGSIGMAFPLWAATAWPIPGDADGDGDYDLLVSCHDPAADGLFFWENTTGATAKHKQAVFLAAKRLSDTLPQLMPSYVERKLRVLSPGWEFAECNNKGLQQKKPIPKIAVLPRGPQQWRYADFNGDGHQDLIVGVAFDEEAHKKQVLRGSSIHVCYGRADGTYAEPFMLLADGKSILINEFPSPNFSNFDADDDLDLLCAGSHGSFIYYENSNTNSEPLYAAGKPLHDPQGKQVTMPSPQIVPIAFDWDRDGDLDLIVGTAEGRVALVENTGTFREHVPIFLQPVFFQQIPPTP